MDRFAQSMLALLILTPFSQDRIQVHQLVVESSRAAADQARLAAALRDLGRAYRQFGRYRSRRRLSRRRSPSLSASTMRRTWLGAASCTPYSCCRSGGWTKPRRSPWGAWLISRRQATSPGKPMPTGPWELSIAIRRCGPSHVPAFERALDLFRRVRDRHREATCMVQFGAAIRMQGDPERARSMCRACGQSSLISTSPCGEPSPRSTTQRASSTSVVTTRHVRSSRRACQRSAPSATCDG